MQPALRALLLESCGCIPISDTVNPISDQCELNGIPCITWDDPWRAWYFDPKGDPKKGFNWTKLLLLGLDLVAHVYADMWLTLKTNRKVGAMLTNDPDGIAASIPSTGFAGTTRVSV